MRLLADAASADTGPMAISRINIADGPGNGVEVVSVSQQQGQAFVVVSSNESDTAVGIRGREVGRASLKVTHDKPTGDPGVDASASALALRVEGEGTCAQGLFIDSTAGTAGTLINARNAGRSQFVVGPDGIARAYGGFGAPMSLGPLGNIVNRMRVYDQFGRPAGYVPVYSG